MRLNCVMFSSNVACEELVLRSLKASPFDKAFPDAWRLAGCEVCIFESFCPLEVRAHIENGFLLTSFVIIYACIQENFFCI